MRPVFALVLALLAGVAQAEDRAVVVGVGGYPFLAKRAETLRSKSPVLKGTVADADAMADALAKRGFRVERILDKDATCEKVLAALDAAKDSSTPNDRFVLYFAGHGCAKPFPAVGPYDAKAPGPKPDGKGRWKPGEDWISAETLNARVKAIPAFSRTVILDTCFSGAMIKDVSEGVTTRFYEPVDDLTKDVEFDDESPSKTFPGKAQASPEVCYVVAASAAQPANEAPMPPGAPNAPRRGIFSYFLNAELDKPPLKADDKAKVSPDVSWGVLIGNVREKIARNEVRLELLQSQTPMVSDPFAARPPFPSPGSASTPLKKPPLPSTLLRLMAAERPNAAALLMTAHDDKTMGVGEPRHIDVVVGNAGYLFVVEQIGNRFHRIYPRGSDATLAEAKMEAGEKPYFSVVSDAPGGLVLKAILIDDAAVAQIFLDKLPTRLLAASGDGMTKEAFAGEGGFTTSMVTLRVADGLLGKLQVKDAGRAWTLLRDEKDKRSKVIRETVERFSHDLLGDLDTAPAENGTKLRSLLNLVVVDRDLAYNLAAAQALPQSLAALGEKRDAEGAVARNVQLLAGLFGDVFSVEAKAS